MWWSRPICLGSLPRAIALCLAFALTACGFTPLYSEDSSARAIDGVFVIENSQTGGFGFAMNERLRTRLGDARTGPYRLQIDTRIDQEERAIRADRSVLRFNLDALAQFAVLDAATGAVLFKDNARSFTAYSAIASPFATRSAEEDARNRLAIALADQIVLRLAATAGDWME